MPHDALIERLNQRTVVMPAAIITGPYLSFVSGQMNVKRAIAVLGLQSPEKPGKTIVDFDVSARKICPIVTKLRDSCLMTAREI